MPFASPAEAEVAFNSLRVDKEPIRGGASSRVFSLKDQILVVDLEADDAKSLRVSVSSLMDLLILVIKTIQRFGPVAKSDA